MEATNAAGTAAGPAAAPDGETLRAATAALAAQHGAGGAPEPVFKRPVGRPRKDGLPAGSVGPRPLAPMAGPLQAAPGPEPAVVVDPALVRSSVIALLKTVDGMIVRRVYRATIRLGGDEALAKEFALEAGLKTEQADLMANMSAELCQKYNFAAQYAPEIFLGIGVVSYATQVALIFRKLDDMAKLKARAEGKAKDAAA